MSSGGNSPFGIPDFQSGPIKKSDLSSKLKQLWTGIGKAFNISWTEPFRVTKNSVVAIRENRPAMVRLSGSGNPYSGVEVLDNGTTYPTVTGGRTFTSNIYEANGTSGLAGLVFQVESTSASDWRFVDNTTGGPPPHSCSICYTVLGCTGLPVAGATVTLNGPSGFHDTCTTDSHGVCCIDISSGGSGTYSGGISATGFTGLVISGFSVTCGGTTFRTATLTNPSGSNICACGCGSPISDGTTLTITWASTNGGGTTSLVYDGGQNAFWGCQTITGAFQFQTCELVNTVGPTCGTTTYDTFPNVAYWNASASSFILTAVKMPVSSPTIDCGKFVQLMPTIPTPYDLGPLCGPFFVDGCGHNRCFHGGTTSCPAPDPNYPLAASCPGGPPSDVFNCAAANANGYACDVNPTGCCIGSSRTYPSSIIWSCTGGSPTAVLLDGSGGILGTIA